MPQVKIDHIVSFSSEDPEHPARSLLAREAGRGRWACARGQPEGSVVLQLARSVQISSVQIGVHHAALVEVLVGRSETPSEPFKVLVPRSVFLSPAESRADAGAGAERVRSFGSGALDAAAAPQRWDRVRLVCSQPYNKHCQYGISFIHIFELESSAPAPPAPPQVPATPLAMAAAAAAACSSDEEEFRPGELFQQHRSAAANTDTGAQIRQASFHALKNIPDSATRLVKTALCKHRPGASARPAGAGAGAGAGGEDTHKPNNTDKHNKTNDKTPRTKRDHPSSSAHSKKDRNIIDSRKDRDDVRKDNSQTASQREYNDVRNNDSESNSGKVRDMRKDINVPSRGAGAGAGAGAGSAVSRGDSDGADGAPLRGAVLVFSGYENPRRARLRDLALSLGARVARAWGPGCTHLICAFPNTPKLRAVRAAEGGAHTPVTRAEWLEGCGRRARRLPWQWFATEPAQRRAPPPPSPPPRSGDESDTDDEIERVLRRQKRARVASRSPSPVSAASLSPTSTVSPRRSPSGDERILEHVTPEHLEDGGGRALPPLFAGRTFVVRAARARPLDAALLARYCRAYGGRVAESEAAEESEDCYVLCGADGEGGEGGAGGVRVRGDWVWACHRQQRLCPLEPYLLQ